MGSTRAANRSVVIWGQDSAAASEAPGSPSHESSVGLPFLALACCIVVLCLGLVACGYALSRRRGLEDRKSRRSRSAKGLKDDEFEDHRSLGDHMKQGRNTHAEHAQGFPMLYGGHHANQGLAHAQGFPMLLGGNQSAGLMIPTSKVNMPVEPLQFTMPHMQAWQGPTAMAPLPHHIQAGEVGLVSSSSFARGQVQPGHLYEPIAQHS